MKQYLDTLCGLAAKRGYDPEEVRKRHGKLNIREICKRFGIEKAYLVDFAFESSHVHEKHVAYSSYSFDKDGRRFFNLGIVEEGIPHAVADILINLSRVLVVSSRLLEDESLIKKSEVLAKSVHKVLECATHIG